MGDPNRSRPLGQSVDLASLRARVRQLERGGSDAVPAGERFSLGLAELDAHLGGGLAVGRVHEILGTGRGEARDGAAFGFAAALLRRLAARGGEGEVLWCLDGGNLFGGTASGRGLAGFGLDPARILWVAARDADDRLWAMEEGLRCPGLLAVVGELGKSASAEAERIAARRLQLAAEAGGVTGLLVRAGAAAVAAGAGESRWRVAPAPSAGDLRPVWSVRLERLRGGRPAEWRLAWDAVAGRLVPGLSRSEVAGRARPVATDPAETGATVAA